ncbi:MAG TPA: hypothetical protein VFE53_23790 [Mucilaginibacter sp.]|nr:hypothetical protein [Mucilaginibacter sp.]
MKKLSLLITLLLAVLLLQNCKKDTITETATSNNTLFAVINDTTWSAVNIQASLTYSSATKTKVFTCTGTATNQEVTFNITANNTTNTASFPLQTFNDDGSTITFGYLRANSSGTYIPQGTVAAGSGSITFTAVDSVAHKCSGIFSCLAKHNNYDNNGNLISVTINEVQDGAFNNLPYTFISN